jgi:hypothetical protein
MKNAILVQVVCYALLVGCLTSPWAHATEPLTTGERGQRLLSGTHAFPAKPAAAPHARGYLLPKPQIARLVHRPGAPAVTPRGTSAALLSANAKRPSGVFGTAGRSTASLKPASGNGVVGGPSNSRTVIKARIDGSAFHRRS